VTDDAAPAPAPVPASARPGWIPDAERVAMYEASDGREGGELMGRPVVVVHVTGARSGTVRKVPLMRVEHDGSYAIVASKGGAPAHPAWYHSVVANPRVRLQDGAALGTYVAHEATGDERAAWWERAVATWPDYASYATRTSREIPVLVLTPADDEA
jgi:deazaflavin-dependent oxidoreductase (nitroreductase family)